MQIGVSNTRHTALWEIRNKIRKLTTQLIMNFALSSLNVFIITKSLSSLNNERNNAGHQWLISQIIEKDS